MKRRQGLSNPRVQAGLLLCVGLFVLPLGALAWLTTPGFMEPMFADHSWDIVAALGIVGIVVGEILMHRIYARKPETAESEWRYREF
jgi:hypothetical protein